MSGIIGHMDSSHKRITVLFAIAAVTMMLAVPFVTVIDSDAEDIKKDSAGYAIKMKDPTDEELEQFDLDKKSIVEEAIHTDLLTWYNTGSFDKPSVTMDSFSQTSASGVKITSDSYTSTNVSVVKSDGLKYELIADTDGQLVDSDPDEDMEEIVNAIKAYFGNDVKKGDKIVISGEIKYSVAYRITYDLAKVDDDNSVVTGGNFVAFVEPCYNLTFEFVKTGQTSGKSITISSSLKQAMEQKETYDYHGKQYSDLTPQDPCTITSEQAKVSLKSGSAKFTIDGKDYPYEIPDGEENKEDTYAKITENSAINCDYLKGKIEKLPESTDHITVGKEYKDLESAYDDIVVEVAGKKVQTFLLIGVAALVLILVAIFAFVIHRRKQAQ